MSLLLLLKPHGSVVFLDATLTGHIAVGRSGQVDGNFVLTGQIDMGDRGRIDSADRGFIATSSEGSIEE